MDSLEYSYASYSQRTGMLLLSTENTDAPAAEPDPVQQTLRTTS